MQNKISFFSNVPRPIRQLIASNLSAKDAVNFMKAAKFINEDFKNNITRMGQQINCLEAFIEDKILEKEIMSPIMSELEKKDYYLYLFKGLNLEDKKQLFKILYRFLYSPGGLDIQASRKNAWKMLEELLEKFELNELPLPVKDSHTHKWILPATLQNKLEKISPVLLTFAHQIKSSFDLHDNLYLCLLLYATKGQDIRTLQNLKLNSLNDYTAWDLVSQPYSDEKILELFQKQYKVKEIDVTDHLKVFIELFTSAKKLDIFNKTFPILYSKLDNLIESATLPIIAELLSHPSAWRWLGYYSNEQIREMIDYEKILFSLWHLSENNHKKLSQNPALLDLIQLITSPEVVSAYSNPETLKKFSYFLNFYFNSEGIEHTLELANIKPFLIFLDKDMKKRLPGDRRPNDFLDYIFRLKLEFLKLIPEDMWGNLKELYTNYIKFNKLNITFYQTLYFHTWPFVSKRKLTFNAAFQEFLNEKKPNLYQWTIDELATLDIRIIKKMPAEFLEFLTPKEYQRLYSMLLALVNSEAQEKSIFNFLNEIKNKDFLKKFVNFDFFDHPHFDSRNHLDCLRYLTKIQIKDESINLLDKLNGNVSFISMVLVNQLISFKLRYDNNNLNPVIQADINKALINIITTGIFDYISSSNPLISTWMHYIFAENYQKNTGSSHDKIINLQEVVRIIRGKRFENLFKSYPPKILCALLSRQSPSANSQLKILADATSVESLEKLDKNDDPQFLEIKTHVIRLLSKDTRPLTFSSKRKSPETTIAKEQPNKSQNVARF